MFFDDHEVVPIASSGIDDEDGDVEIEMKKRNFEFLNNVLLMRFVRAFLLVQLIALMLRSQDRAVPLPPLFNAVWGYFLVYMLAFYSRPFVDLILLVLPAFLFL